MTWFDALIPASIRQMSQAIAASYRGIHERFSYFSSLCGIRAARPYHYSALALAFYRGGISSAELFSLRQQWPGNITGSEKMLLNSAIVKI